MLKRCVIHCHSEYSKDSSWKIADIITACQQHHIDVIALTDHDTIKGARALQAIAPDWLQVIIGQEISTQVGEVIGLFLQEEIPSHLTIEETIARIHTQGGLVLLPHPFDRLRRQAVGLAVAEKVKSSIDIIETFNARCVFMQDNVKAQQFAKQYHVAGIAAADAHFLREINNAVCLLQDCSTPSSLLASLHKDKAHYQQQRASFFVHVKSAIVRGRKKITIGQSTRALFLSALTIFYLVMALRLTRGMGAASVVSWMNIFDVKDFHTWPEIFTYFKNLRTGIPPLLAFIEILDYRYTGNLNFLLMTVYRWSIIGSFLLAFFLGSRSLILRTCSMTASLVLIAAIASIHHCNAQLYDVMYPFFILIYISCLVGLHHYKARWLVIMLALFAGFATTAMELSRPFGLFLIPFMIIGITAAVRRLPQWKHILLYFLFPIVLLSGTWHLKLFLFNNGQLLWSNHAGYNLERLWDPTLQLPYPPTMEEPQSGPIAGRAYSLNSNEHNVNSNIIKETIVRFIFTNPTASAQIVDTHLLSLLKPEVTLYTCILRRNIPTLYGPVLHVLFLWLMAGLLGIVYWTKAQRSSQLLTSPIALWIILTCATIFFLAIGEQGEEARFVVTFLPLLAGLPLPRLFPSKRSGHHQDPKTSHDSDSSR